MILKYMENDRWIYVDNITKFDTAYKPDQENLFVSYKTKNNDTETLEIKNEAYLLNDNNTTIQILKSKNK